MQVRIYHQAPYLTWDNKTGRGMTVKPVYLAIWTISAAVRATGS